MNTTIQGPTMTVHSDPVSAPTDNESGRCQFRYSNGKRCRLPGSEPHFGLCSHHFSLSKPRTSQQSFNDSEDLSAELLPELSETRSGVDISKFLSRLLILITKGRISPRRASVLAYVTNQLQHPRRASARDYRLPRQSRRHMLDFSDSLDPANASAIKGPAWYVRAVEAAMQVRDKSSS